MKILKRRFTLAIIATSLCFVGLFSPTSVYSQVIHSGVPGSITPSNPMETISPFQTTSLQPVVQIDVKGNNSVPSDQIMQAVSSKVGDTWDEAKLKRDVQSIYDLGFFTDVKVDTIKVEKGVKVVFLVLENPIVQEVDVVGAELVPVTKVKNLMKTVTGKILNTRTLYGDVLAINEYYENQGYTDPSNHIIDLSWSKQGKVSLKIQEGIVIKKIMIQGNSVYPSAKLMKLIHSQVGEVFNRKKMEADIGNIASLYKEDDYVLTGLKGNIKPDGTAVIDITETRIEGMRVEGNTKTKDYVIYRQIKTKVGDVLRSKRIQKDIERLNNTGFFENANVEPEEGTEPGKVILVWKVKEQKTGTASLGLGYGGASGSNRAGLTGAVSVSEKNIKGTGQAAYIQWQRGVLVDSITVGYTNPWIDKHEDSISVAFFRSNYFDQAEVIPGTNPVQFTFFSDHRAGASVTGGRPVFNEDTHAFLTLTHENVSTTGIINPLNSTLLLAPVAGTVNSLTGALVRDTRDDVFDTFHGSYYSGSAEHAGQPLGGTFDFNKQQVDVRKYFPFFSKSTVAFHVLAGWGEGNVPITDWYVLGGSDTLRGYSLNRFIGTRMILGSAEYRFPVGKQKIFKGAVFFDVGRAWQPIVESVNFRQLAKDYGIGIRMKLPNLGLGIIRLDFAFGGEGTRSVIGIGQTF